MPRRSMSIRFGQSGSLVLALVLATLCIAISAAEPRFHSAANIIAILRQCALVLIAACAMTMLVIAAEVDLSVGASLAFVGGIGMAGLNATHSLALGLLAGLAFAGGVGLANGLIVAGLKQHRLAGFTALGAGHAGVVPIPVIVAALIFLIAWMTLRLTVLGRFIYAVGANERALRLSGVRSERLKLFAFVLTGLCVGVAGMILSSLMNAGQPT